MQRIVLAFFLVLQLSCVFVQAQTIVYVAPDGTGNGTSWANPSGLQDAVDNASAGDEIWLEQGTYTITQTLAASASNLHIYGGFEGTETARNQRDWQNNTTILDGQTTVKIMRVSSSNSVLDGITFINGFVTGSVTETNDGGGALRLAGDNTLVVNCTFRDNVSQAERGGGAIFIWHGGGHTIDNCVFENNRNINISGNGGGAIHNWDDDLTIRNTQFRNNTSTTVGGAIYTWQPNVLIDGCVFENNESEGNGGAIYNNAELSVSNSLFNKNTTAALGGAIYSGEELYVTNSTFVSNDKTAIVHPHQESTSLSTYRTYIFNSIFFGNTSGTVNGTDLWPDVDRNNFHPDESETDFRRNIFQENTTNNTNNLIGIDPLFQDFSGDDFSLRDNSPAVEYGRNNLYTNVRGNGPGADDDLAGNPRLFGPYVDAGAYELQSTSTLTPPGCAANITPADNAIDVPLDADITWDAVPEALGYRIFIGTTSNGVEVADGEEVTGTSFSLSTGFEENTTYYVRVVPFNTAGEAGDCEEISFTTETVLEAPDCTVINAPVNGAGDVALDATITWEEVDNADGYLVYIGTTSGGTDVVDGEEVAGTSFTPVDGWDEGETYYVRVVPYHAGGEATGCAEISFTTVARPEPPQADDQQFCPPATVTDLVAVGTAIRWYDQATGGSPLSATTVLSTGTYYATQTVGGMESDRRTVAVTVQSPTAPQFVGDITGCGGLTIADLEDVETGLRWYDQATGGTALSPTTALSTGTYYASRVSGTCESDRTAVQVIINVTPVPDVPDQTFVVGSTFAELNIIGQNLRWYTEPSGSTPFDPQMVISDGTYYVSQTIDGCESDRVIVQINITPVPGCVTNISPIDNATNVSVGANITWDAVAEADGYRIYIGTASGSADVVDGAEVTGTSYNLTGGFDEGTTYYVIVIPYNDAGEADGCTEISFTTEAEEEPTPVTPECTVIILPTDGATDVAIDAAITWEEVDNTDGYLVYIGTTPGRTDVVDGEELTGTSFIPADGWDEGETYYVRVVPFNAAGEAEGCGEISFTTEEEELPPVTPECTTITAPTNGATDVALDAGITWEPVDNAAGYRIYIGTTSGGTEITNGEEVTGTTFRPANGWEENTTYYVTIVPYNEAGEAESCTPISFTTETLLTIPGCTTIISPVDGAGSASLDGGIIWTAVDGAEGYRVSIGTTPGGTDVVNEEEVTGTTFDPGVIFAENTRYYLTVTPFNAAGEAPGCGQTWFVIIPDEDNAINRTKYGLSPNGDGINDFWQIDGIENYTDNAVSIFNRWGDMVFQIQNYDNVSKVFNGVANRMTNLGAGVLPSGTYFFTIQYRDNQETKKVEGFLVLRR